MSEQLIACCGLDCAGCGAFLATKANDAAKAAEVAAEWSQMFHVEVKVEHVWCDGCRQPGKKCAHCDECEIRACAVEKGLANCGLCDDMPTCATLGALLSQVPPARAALERIRAQR